MHIEYKSDYQGPNVRIAIQFVTKSGPLTIRRAIIVKSEGLKMNLSPIKLAEHPQLMITAVCTGIVNAPSVIQIKYTQNAQERSLDFSLPIFVHKFMQPHNIPEDNYRQFYDEYSSTENPSIFKLDEFIPNPAPPNVPLSQVLQKFGSLFGGGLKIKANAWPNSQNIKQVWGTSQYCYKPENDMVMLPILVEVEAYEECTDTLRLSIRAGGSPFLVQALYQIIMYFVAT